jgi:glycosyltransferase involved in cell wall biosynthesis
MTTSLTPRLSVIVPIRNRSGDRLENCLRSLRWQEGIEADQVEVIVVDFGSDLEHREAVEKACAQFEAKIERVEITGMWNRSKALNHGLRAARGVYLFCTDVDMIFSPNFLEEMMKAHRAAESRGALDMPQRGVIVFSRCQDLPASFEMRSYELEDYDALLSISDQRGTNGTGACQSAHRDLFYALRGYDEAFQHWGAEDDDLRHRALKYGLSPQWISPVASMLHQWHPTTKHQRPIRKRLNQWRLYATRWRIKKNHREWGGRP